MYTPTTKNLGQLKQFEFDVILLIEEKQTHSEVVAESIFTAHDEVYLQCLAEDLTAEQTADRIIEAELFTCYQAA